MARWRISRGVTVKPQPCESYAQHQKIDRYAGAFEKSDYDFAPGIFETSGAVNKEGETVLKQIIRFASKRENISHSVYASRACLAASAQQILNRDFVDIEEVAVLSVSPRIPSFSISGDRSPVSASLNTRFLRRLCLVILSPDFLQHKGWSPSKSMVCWQRGHGAEVEYTG